MSVVLCLLATMPAIAASPAGNAFLSVATKDGWARGPPKLSQQIEIASDVTSFGLDYTIALSKDRRKCSSEHWSWSIKCVTLGMPSPIRANWYSTGFLKIRLDGLSLHDLPTRFEPGRRGGPDAMAAGTWHTSKGDLTLRLLMRSDDDKLFMQLTLAPDAAVERLELDLLSYPQGFEKPHNRRAFTAARDVPAPTGIELDPDRECWALYYDDSRGVPRAGGPCGIVYVPSETESVRVQVGCYENLTTLRARPEGRRLTVALWDFSFLPDRDANKA